MTAQIVGHVTRLSYPDLGVTPNHEHSGDDAGMFNAVVPGQLWERARDHSSFLAVVITPTQWERMCNVRNGLGTRNRRVTMDNVRGPLALFGMACDDPAGVGQRYSIMNNGAGGVIRAGKRVK